MKSVHDMTPGELRAEVQRLRDESRRDADERLKEWARVQWTCPACGDNGGPGPCRECEIDTGEMVQRVPGAELIVRALAEYDPANSSTASLNGADGLIARAKRYCVEGK